MATRRRRRRARSRGSGDYLAGLSDSDRDNQLVLFFSQQAGENLIDFFQTQRGIVPTSDVSDALANLPVGVVPILATLPCRPPMLRSSASTLRFSASVGAPKATTTVYAAGPVTWTARAVTPDRFSNVRASDANVTTLAVTGDTSGLPVGSILLGSVLMESPDAVNSPYEIRMMVDVTP
jgi:hypothetical protein